MDVIQSIKSLKPFICLGAYTGPTPAKGYVGYVNIGLEGDQVKFTVRSEGVWSPSYGTSESTVPKAEAIKMLREALAKLEA